MASIWFQNEHMVNPVKMIGWLHGHEVAGAMQKAVAKVKAMNTKGEFDGLAFPSPTEIHFTKGGAVVATLYVEPHSPPSKADPKRDGPRVTQK